MGLDHVAFERSGDGVLMAYVILDLARLVNLVDLGFGQEYR